MTQLNTGYYEENQTYYLEESNPATRVMIGTYRADEFGNNGGIIMLKPLEDDKFSIFWEVTSPMLWTPPVPRRSLEDINNDGLKELITYWEGGMYDAMNPHYEFWILTFDPKTKTYKVLNPIVDKDKFPAADFDFEKSVPSGGKYLNRFQTDSRSESVFDMIRDIDGDGVAEVVLHHPALESHNAIHSSEIMIGRANDYHQVYKLGSSGYYLWKETTEVTE